jgi:hypothetical protein
MRQIVSFIQLPSRPSFRRASRAFNFIVDKVWQNFDFGDLSTIKLKALLARLKDGLEGS